MQLFHLLASNIECAMNSGQNSYSNGITFTKNNIINVITRQFRFCSKISQFLIAMKTKSLPILIS